MLSQNPAHNGQPLCAGFLLCGEPSQSPAVTAVPFWHFVPPPPARGSLSRRGSLSPSPSAPVGRIHLSQRERQEALPVCPWCPFKKEARSVPTTVLALPLGELANPKGLTERAKGSPFWRCKAPERGCAPECCPFSPLARMLPQGASASGCRLPLRSLP